jgi:hypothetical protein
MEETRLPGLKIRQDVRQTFIGLAPFAGKTNI